MTSAPLFQVQLTLNDGKVMSIQKTQIGKQELWGLFVNGACLATFDCYARALEVLGEFA